MEETPNKYTQAIKESNVCTDDAQVKAEVAKLLAEHVDENRKQEVYQFMLNCIDLTTLSSTDSERSVAAFTQKVNDFETNYPQLKNVAAICVYSNFAGVVRSALEVSEVNVAVCSANFPSSQARLEVKCAETALAVADGANEVAQYLNAISPYSSCYQDVEKLRKEVASKLNADELREWNFQSKQYEDSQAYKKSIVKACRDVGMAWANNQPKSIAKTIIRGWW